MQKKKEKADHASENPLIFFFYILFFALFLFTFNFIRSQSGKKILSFLFEVFNLFFFFYF